MISENLLPELRTYRRIEKALPLEEDDKYGSLVVASTNETLPVHRWFRFKEAFSPDLLGTVLSSLKLREPVRVLDPFCGVGTTLIASQELLASGQRILAMGIERNPFVAFTARTKASWPSMSPARIREWGRRLLDSETTTNASVPSLSGLTSGRCISTYMSRRLRAVRHSLLRRPAGPDRDALMLGLAAAIEPVSRVRKDGRMLRLVDKPQSHLDTVLAEKWERIASDVEFLRDVLGKPPVPKVVLGDGRQPSAAGVEHGSIDLVFTSPPYPNNIDYSEVYKLELWLMGFVSTQQEFLDLRYSTFRSHPTTRPADLPQDLRDALAHGHLGDLLRPILIRTKKMTKKWRHRLLSGYSADLWNSLKEYHRCLRRGGYCVMTVGNSLHGSSDSPYLVPTDLMICTMASRLGFAVQKSIVARGLRRRLPGNHFLRESVVILRKTNG